jgi:hypothetical protein
MIRLHQTNDVARPIDDVFACTGRFSHAAQWDPDVADSRKSGRGPIRVGTVFELRSRLIVPGLPASTMPASPQPG